MAIPWDQHKVDVIMEDAWVDMTPYIVSAEMAFVPLGCEYPSSS